MESLFLAIITIFIIGLGSYLLGYFMINSKWKKKHQTLTSSFLNMEINYSRHQEAYRRSMQHQEELEKSYIKLKKDRDAYRKRVETIEQKRNKNSVKKQSILSSDEYLNLKRENKAQLDQIERLKKQVNGITPYS